MNLFLFVQHGYADQIPDNSVKALKKTIIIIIIIINVDV